MSDNFLSEGAAVISALTALIAVFSSAIKAWSFNLYLYFFKKQIQIHYYNKARNHSFKNNIVTITPELTIINNSPDKSYVVYSLKFEHPNEFGINIDNIEQSLKFSGEDILPDSFINIIIGLLKDQEYINDSGKFLPNFKPNDYQSFQLDERLDKHKEEIFNKLCKLYIHHKSSVYNKWIIKDENGNSVETPFILKPKSQYLLTLEQTEIKIDSRILKINPNLTITLHEQKNDYMFEFNYEKVAFLKYKERKGV